MKIKISVQAPYKTQDIYMVILGKMSSGKMFYTKKDGAKYFILGKMSSGRQKKFCIKKKGEYINMKASPYKPV